MKNFNFFTQLSIRVFILGWTWIFLTFILEYPGMIKFLGDTPEKWGIRHWIYLWIGIVLGLIQIIYIIRLCLIQAGEIAERPKKDDKVICIGNYSGYKGKMGIVVELTKSLCLVKFENPNNTIALDFSDIRRCI